MKITRLHMYHKMMDEIYSDLYNPAGLASIDKLYAEKEFFGTKILKLCIKYYQENFQDVKLGHTLVCDVFYMSLIIKSKTLCILALVDGYSRYLNIIPLQ